MDFFFSFPATYFSARDTHPRKRSGLLSTAPGGAGLWQGTHKGDGLGFAATGHAIKLTGITIIEIENGMMIHGWNNWDQLGMMQQLGMAPGEVKVDGFLEERV
jgi:hypothetical protein